MTKTNLTLILLFTVTLSTTTAFALDVVVDSRGLDYGDYTTIGAALAAVASAGSGGTVLVNPGTDGVYQERELNIPSDTVLRSALSGSGYITIDAQNLGRVIALGLVENIRIEGFIITNGDGAPSSAFGGGLSIYRCTNVYITDCIIRENSASVAGGAYVYRSDCSFEECEFLDNSALPGTYPTIGLGGGLHLNRSTVHMILCNVTGNTAANNGGGVYLDDLSVLNARGSTISNNHANGSGGGCYIIGDTYGRSILYLVSGEILLNTAGGDAPDGLISEDSGPNQASLTCIEYDPLNWVVQGDGVLAIDTMAGSPCAKMSEASFSYDTETVSVAVAPLGNYAGPAESRLWDVDEPVDGTVSVILRNYLGAPVNGYGPRSIWLESEDGGMALRPPYGSNFGVRYASIADGATGYTGTNGETTISQPIYAGGHSNYPDEKCLVMTEWGPVGWGSVANPDGIRLNMYFNSPDINGDFNVDLDDCIAFAAEFGGTEPDYGFNFEWDDVINIPDLIRLTQHCGEVAGEIKYPDAEQAYTLELLFDVDGQLTRCFDSTEFAGLLNAYVMIRNYTGGPIMGWEFKLTCTDYHYVTNQTYAGGGINFGTSEFDYIIACTEPYIPSWTDAILMELGVVAIPGTPLELTLENPSWTSIPGRPAPALRGASPGEFYQLLSPTGDYGDVIASVNAGCTPLADYGDAPDHPDGYFPTRFATTSGGGIEPGVHHLNVTEEWLGDTVTLEYGAEDPTDPDGVQNLINGDAGDDGILEIFKRRSVRIDGTEQYWLWVKAKATVAAEAPVTDRWLHILFDVNGDGQWKNENRSYLLPVPPGESRTYTMWMGKCDISAMPLMPEPHNWLRATFSRETLPRNWAGTGQLAYGETEDYDRVFSAEAPPGFEAYGKFMSTTRDQPSEMIARLKIPEGCSVELVDIEIQDHGPINRTWAYQGVDPTVFGSPTPAIGSFIDGSPDMQYVRLPVAPIAIDPGYRIQTFGVSFRLNGYDGPQGTGNLVWSTTAFSGAKIQHPRSKDTEGFGELAFGGASVQPVDQPIPIYPDGGVEPMAYVVFGNDQPTPGTLSIIQAILDDAPEADMLPVVNIVDADFDFDLNTPATEPLVSTTITGLYLTGYDDAMLTSASIDETDLVPYWIPFDADDTYDIHTPAGRMFHSGYDIDEVANLIRIDDPKDFGIFYLGAPSLASAPVSRSVSGGNYPNPFNPSTTISYDLKTASRLVVEVYSLRGELIRTLADGDYPAGRGEVVWDGRGLDGREMPSGVYLYMVNTNGAPKLGKMTLVR